MPTEEQLQINRGKSEKERKEKKKLVFEHMFLKSLHACVARTDSSANGLKCFLMCEAV